jgi:hypothetical protein
MSAGAGRETRGCATFEGNVGASEGVARGVGPLGTHRSREGNGTMSVAGSDDMCIALRKMAITSCWTAVGRGRSRPIRKNVIGHAIPVRILGEQIRERNGFVGVRSALALVHQKAREHGFGIFLDPLLEERGDLLAEIGGVAEAREFEALKRVARSGKQEFPRELGFMNGHGDLLRMIQEE